MRDPEIRGEPPEHQKQPADPEVEPGVKLVRGFALCEGAAGQEGAALEAGVPLDQGCPGHSLEGMFCPHADMCWPGPGHLPAGQREGHPFLRMGMAVIFQPQTCL